MPRHRRTTKGTPGRREGAAGLAFTPMSFYALPSIEEEEEGSSKGGRGHGEGRIWCEIMLEHLSRAKRRAGWARLKACGTGALLGEAIGHPIGRRLGHGSGRSGGFEGFGAGSLDRNGAALVRYVASKGFGRC